MFSKTGMDFGADRVFVLSAVAFLGLLIFMLLRHIFKMASKRRAFDLSKHVKELENIRFKLPEQWSAQEQPLIETSFDQMLPRVHDAQTSLMVLLNEKKTPVLRVLQESLDHEASQELLREVSRKLEEGASRKAKETAVQKALESVFAWWQELRANRFLREFKAREQVALPLPAFSGELSANETRTASEQEKELWSLLLEGSYQKKKWLKLWLIPLGSQLVTLVTTRHSEDEIEWILENSEWRR
jgi:hypothetical protein